jgi:integrase
MRGHIRQRAAGSWTIEASGGFDDGGKRIRLSRTIHGTRRDAEKTLTSLLREIDTGTAARPGTETFEAYLYRWLEHMRPRIRPVTWERYEILIRAHVVPRIGKVRLDKLRPHHLQRVVDEMLATRAQGTASKCYAVMAGSLTQAVRWRLLTVSPATGVAPPRVPRPELRVPSTEEIRRLIDATAGKPWELPVLIAATTGMRRGEVLALRWADVDLDGGTASIRRGKTGTARRVIHIPASTVAALKSHRKAQSERRLLCGAGWLDEDLVVDRGDGGPVIAASLSDGFARIAESVGLGDVRLHDLRHGFAVALLRAGVNVKVVAEALGHSRASFTLDTYMHVLPGMGEQVASVIETALAATSAASRPPE